MMMEMFGGVFVMMLLAYSVVPLFPFVYLLLRWRHGREGGAADPQLGLKVAVYYFMTIGLHVVLMALTMGLYGLVVDRSPETLMRGACGLLLGGGVVYGLHRAILSRVVDAGRRANVARVFAGLNVVLCGLIGMGALIATSVLLLQEHVPEEGFKLAGVVMAVYLGAWTQQVRRLIAMSEVA